MDRRAIRNFMTKRSSVWTLSFCMTGLIVLGGIAAVNNARRGNGQEKETEIGQVAYLEEESLDAEQENDLMNEDSQIFPTISQDNEQSVEEDLALASGTSVKDTLENTIDNTADTAIENADGLDEAAADIGTEVSGNTVSADSDVTDRDAADAEDGEWDENSGDSDADAVDASSANIISEQALLDAGVSFSDGTSLLWPSAGTILIDYSMDGSIYFPTLNQYKYNPALIISSEVGNQVLASAKGIVESIGIDEETGTTLVLNIGNGYKLTYGQLKELAVSEGDVVEEGGLIGYVSEPTKYYSEEGGNLYFAMTQDGQAVDPVLYLE